MAQNSPLKQPLVAVSVGNGNVNGNSGGDDDDGEGGYGGGMNNISSDSPFNSNEPRTLHVNTGAKFPPNDYRFPEIIQNKGKGGAIPPSSAETMDVDVDAEKEKTRLFDMEKEEIQRFLLDKNAEIIVVLEGVDPMTSHNVQSYHSYVSEEIKWDHFFVRCCSVVNGKLYYICSGHVLFNVYIWVYMTVF